MSTAFAIILVLVFFSATLAALVWFLQRALGSLMTHVTALASEILNPIPRGSPEPIEPEYPPEPTGPLPWENLEPLDEPYSVPSTQAEGAGPPP